MVLQCGDVEEIQNESAANQMKLNSQCFVKIVEISQLLVRQVWALRRDNIDDDSNFFQALEFRVKDIPQLMDWMKQNQNKFMGYDIQNQIIQVMANQITRD